MHPTTWTILRSLRSGARLSRNRHYALYQDPRARRAIRLHRYLESVEHAVREHESEISVSVVDREDTAGPYALRIEFPLLRGTRTAYLRETELEFLAEEAPEVARVLTARMGR
jgi:hypothetical protein